VSAVEAKKAGRYLIIQTAFPGDVILTLPMIQVLKRALPEVQIDLVVVPGSAPLLENHPAISNVIVFDKRGRDSGLGGVLNLAGRLRNSHYAAALIPHRSLRSAILAWLARIPVRVAFDKSAGRMLMSSSVPYETGSPEWKRNISLLAPIGITNSRVELPNLYPGSLSVTKIDSALSGVPRGRTLVAIAPCSVWNTKRWLPERFAALSKDLAGSGVEVALIGGKEDVALAEEIRLGSGSDLVKSYAGKLTFLESAELIRRCSAIVCNDSAPMHIAVAMRTPVIAIYGATIPGFGFAPYGDRDQILETNGLSCRPCAIHGGPVCPIGTFECMKKISVEDVRAAVGRIAALAG
jgi:heptosyltransferase-2